MTPSADVSEAINSLSWMKHVSRSSFLGVLYARNPHWWRYWCIYRTRYWSDLFRYACTAIDKDGGRFSVDRWPVVDRDGARIQVDSLSACINLFSVSFVATHTGGQHLLPSLLCVQDPSFRRQTSIRIGSAIERPCPSFFVFNIKIIDVVIFIVVVIITIIIIIPTTITTTVIIITISVVVIIISSSITSIVTTLSFISLSDRTNLAKSA